MATEFRGCESEMTIKLDYGLQCLEMLLSSSNRVWVMWCTNYIRLWSRFSQEIQPKQSFPIENLPYQAILWCQFHRAWVLVDLLRSFLNLQQELNLACHLESWFLWINIFVPHQRVVVLNLVRLRSSHVQY